MENRKTIREARLELIRAIDAADKPKTGPISLSLSRQTIRTVYNVLKDAQVATKTAKVK